jgi:hypothetical protein
LGPWPCSVSSDLWFMLTAIWISWTCGGSHDVPLISLRISDLVRLAGWLSPSLSPRSFHTWRMLKIVQYEPFKHGVLMPTYHSPYMRSAGNIFFPARFWFCTSRRNWSRLRRDFWRFCLVVCSIRIWSALRNKYLLRKTLNPTLLIPPPRVALVLSPAGDP